MINLLLGYIVGAFSVASSVKRFRCPFVGLWVQHLDGELVWLLVQSVTRQWQSQKQITKSSQTAVTNFGTIKNNPPPLCKFVPTIMQCNLFTGYDVIQQDREKGRSNVLRLSHPGCETHFLSTDSVSETQSWFNRIEAVCNTIPDGTELENTNPNLRVCGTQARL